MRTKIKKFLLFTLVILGALGAGVWISQDDETRVVGPRYLIVNADDLGYNQAVTQGIIQAWKEGVVTSTSALINLEGAPQRIAEAHRQNPDLPIGLHINISEGKPVLPPEQVSSLVDENGFFYNATAIVSHFPLFSTEELRAEINAQAERLLETGVVFDHLDITSGWLLITRHFSRL
jgi:predicted glycoside hydrolase/deacetylase ChbG (UPF0249 family)